MDRWNARTGRVLLHPLDTIAAVVIAGLSLAPHELRTSDRPALAVLPVLASTLPIALRRAFPIPVLAITQTALLVEALSVGTERGALGLASALAMYTVARHHERSLSLRIALTVAAIQVSAVLVAVLIGRPGTAVDAIPAVVILAGSWALGDNVRTRRAYLASLEERAERAEAEREENAQRAVLEERARIARELHDVVAHHVSAIAVTAGAAEEAATQQPARAREALRAIQATSRQALSEMRALVGVLETDGAPTTELAPQPGLDDVEGLVAQSRRAGLEVKLRIEGEARRLPEALDLTAYRIVQEALTNILKHAGPARAQVTVRFGDDDLELVVQDDGRSDGSTQAEDGGGRGLVGMRERVGIFHGELSAGRQPAGGYRVVARLPLSGLQS